jgi:hypothetical protein
MLFFDEAKLFDAFWCGQRLAMLIEGGSAGLMN